VGYRGKLVALIALTFSTGMFATELATGVSRDFNA
jgi:hypothetical protein